MLDTRDRHGTNQLTRKTSGPPAPSPHVTTTATTHMEGSHPLQQLQLPRHGDNVSGSPELAAATEDDYYARGGEKKGRVKQVSRGRKRRLDDQALDTDGDYGPAPSSNHPLPAKRPRTHDETGPVQAADEKQRAGCTDEDLLQQQVERETDHYNEDQVEEEEEGLHHVVDYDVPDPPPRTWVAKAEWALGRLGGRGTLADIYSTIEEAFPEEVDGKRNWKAAIRSCLSKNEKNKFFKPEASATSAKGDHVWCLAASSRRAAPPTKRGRPAGRSKRSSSATTTTASTTGATRTGRSRGRSRSAPLYNEEEAEEEEKKQVEFVVPRAPVKREDRNVVEDEARRLETLLQRKQQLEQDISRLQEEVNEDGLSADQEDFLSQLLA